MSFGDWAVRVEGPETPRGLTPLSRSLNDWRVTGTINYDTILVVMRCMSVPWLKEVVEGKISAFQPHQWAICHTVTTLARPNQLLRRW